MPGAAISPRLTETTPLLTRLQAQMKEAGSLEAPVEFGPCGVVVDYDPQRLASLSTLYFLRGTILINPILVFELIALTLLFVLVGVPLYIFQSRTVGLLPGDIRRQVLDKITDQEANIRAFSMIMTMLAAFLLSLYTSIMLGRWWTIRTGGIGAIKAAASELVLLLSQMVTQEEQVLSAVERHARASLWLLFMWRRGLLADEKEVRRQLVDVGQILTNDEVDKLLSPEWNHNLYESIWTWNTAIVQKLHAEGRVKSEALLVTLLEKCAKGRAGVQLAVTHLATKVPMQYVHLISFIVKLHNIICAVLMGIIFSSALKQRNVIVCLQLYFRTVLMPFLFNAILLINAELSDPFDGGPGDFPQEQYDKGVRVGVRSFVEAKNSLPLWLVKRREKIGTSWF